MDAEHAEAQAAYRQSIRALLEKYRDPARLAALFQQAKLTGDDKEYMAVTLVALSD